MPRTKALRIGAATAAAVAALILAITSVAAHASQASSSNTSAKSVSGMLTGTTVSGLKEAAILRAEAAKLADQKGDRIGSLH